jgi:hypothetical protein
LALSINRRPSHTAAASSKVFSLAQDFAPDPVIADSSVTADQTAETVGQQFPKSEKAHWDHCVGYYTLKPNHAFELTSRFDMLRVFVTSNQDTTLVVRKPDGEVFCVDDTGIGGYNPIIGRAYAPGVYQVWVGTKAKGSPVPYQLYLTAKSSTSVPRLGRWW